MPRGGRWVQGRHAQSPGGGSWREWAGGVTGRQGHQIARLTALHHFVCPTDANFQTSFTFVDTTTSATASGVPICDVASPNHVGSLGTGDPLDIPGRDLGKRSFCRNRSVHPRRPRRHEQRDRGGRAEPQPVARHLDRHGHGGSADHRTPGRVRPGSRRGRWAGNRAHRRARRP
jgi:hypothetical protein